MQVARGLLRFARSVGVEWEHKKNEHQASCTYGFAWYLNMSIPVPCVFACLALQIAEVAAPVADLRHQQTDAGA